MAAGASLARLLRSEAHRELRAWRREVERPWREGRRGAVAETGRWVGFALAIVAFAGGAGAAAYVEWRRSR
ncbi:MAG: hypothetical protein ACE5HP_09885 [Gemmatimonadota bacterium]